MPSDTTINHRIRVAAEKRGLTQSDLARAMSVTRNAVYQWWTGGTRPSKESITKLAEVLDVEEGWLRTGISEVSDGEEILLPSDKLENRLRADPGFNIVEIDVRVGAGAPGWPQLPQAHDAIGNDYTGEPIRARWGLPPALVREALKTTPDNIRVFEVIGDSMEPRLSEGDRVFIDTRQTHPAPEGIFALNDGLGLVVKRLQIIHGSDPVRVRIISVNPAYPPQERNFDEIQIIGRLAGRFTVN